MSGEVWADDLSDITAADAFVAMREHYRTSTEYLMPVHIVRIVKAMNAKETMSPDVPQDCGAHKWTKDGSCAKCLTWKQDLDRDG